MELKLKALLLMALALVLTKVVKEVRFLPPQL
jgi:hypothetical protein